MCNADLIVNLISVALLLVAVGAHVWRLFYGYRLSARRMGEPALLKKDMAQMISTALMLIPISMSLGIVIGLLQKNEGTGIFQPLHLLTILVLLGVVVISVYLDPTIIPRLKCERRRAS